MRYVDQVVAWCKKLKSRIENWKRDMEIDGEFIGGYYGPSFLHNPDVIRIVLLLNRIQDLRRQYLLRFEPELLDLRKLITENGMKDPPTEQESCYIRSNVSSSPPPETHGTGCVVTHPTPSVS